MNDHAGPLAGIDLNLVRVFEAVLVTGTVTAAARRLGLTQAATSNALRRLRTQLRDPLFVRAGGRLVQTPLAARLAPRVEDVCAALASVFARDTFEPQRSTATLRIATSDHVDCTLLEPFGRSLLEAAPKIAIVVEPFSSDACRRAIAGELDWVLAPRARLDDALRVRRVLSEPFALIARTRHPRRRQLHTLAEYTRLSHVLVAPVGGANPTAVDRALASRGLERRVVRTVASFAHALLLVSESDVVATVPRSIAERFASPLRHVVVPPPLPLPRIEIDLAWPQRLHLDPLDVWLRDRLVRTAVSSRNK